MGHTISVLGLDRWMPFGKSGHVQMRQPRGDSGPVHLRMALEELGTTFIKLGQILSTRSDLLPPEYQAELTRLQDAAPPIAPDIVRETVVAELGKSTEAAFASFDFTPLASASIGQAHAATLLDGTEVVVKVRRPGVVEQVEEDLEILQNLAVRASRRWELADQYDLPGLAQEFAQTLREELDYLREARNAERFAANFADDTSIHIPRVYWETTTSRLLTLQHVYGIKITDLAALDAAQIDRQALAQRAAKLILHMVFEDGFFHADPHPGNFFVETDGRIGLIDFGMVGILDTRLQEQLVSVLGAVAEQDAGRLVDVLQELGVARHHIDRDALQVDLDRALRHYRNGARKPLGFSQGMNGLPVDNTRTHVLSYQAGETAKLAGETRSPHKPCNGCSKHLAAVVTAAVPPECALRVARPVDGPLETALGRRMPPRTVKR